jgi:hypothetical protein
MSPLASYVLQHTDIVAYGGEDLLFFKGKPCNDPDKDQLRELVRTHASDYPVTVLDAAEHSYLVLGGWVGSQEIALRLMGLGSALGVWSLLSPRTFFGADLEDEKAHRLAGTGLVSITAPPAAFQ